MTNFQTPKPNVLVETHPILVSLFLANIERHPFNILMGQELRDAVANALASVTP